MLACVACSKHEQGDGEDHSAAPAPAPNKPSSRDAVKSLTSQLKDMMLKFSGTHRHCKGSSSSLGKSKSLHHHHYHHRSSYVDRDVASDAGSQSDCIGAAGSSSSTPAWDFSSYSNNKVGLHEEEGGEQDVVAPEEEAEPKEWMAQVEPGVHITFVSLPGGAGNDLKRIRFSREMFNKWQAQRWWGENYDRIMELYNVRSFSRQAFPIPPGSDDGEREWSSSFNSRDGPSDRDPLVKERFTTNTYVPPSTSGEAAYCPPVPDPSQHLLLPQYFNPAAFAAAASAVGVSGVKVESSSMDASRTTTSSRASISISNASDLDVTEWVENDEPGVYITIRELADGTRELRRVRFSRERFGEVRAKQWWEENRERIQAQYL
ncbi:protein Brevis radix-like 4 [Musa acuminata AAA Group]|uniref:protein Brevis radix-like 4 n=1 Tax=Musa acuminata AAA Group TaxID=214697 RepID=UPI0031DE2558